MSKCESCRNALWDYFEYYGTNAVNWFICGCKKDLEEAECGDDDYEELQMDI